jgi:uncharacterized protein (DUF58 family)
VTGLPVAIPAEILKQVKLLEIRTRKMVNNLFAGEYHTAFKGRGMTFADFREYVPGDDVRTISWTLTARAGKPYIKRYDEEREMTLMLVVDISGSGDFGSGQYFKGEIIAQLAALLGFSATKNNDQVGLLLFSDQVELYVPPKKGRGHVYRILREVLFYQPVSRKTKIANALEYLRGVLKKKANIFIFSDFMDHGFEMQLRQLARKHDTVAVIVQDPTELELPDIGFVDMHDAETGATVSVDTSNPRFRKVYNANLKKLTTARDQELQRCSVDKVQITSGEKFVDPLVAFFRGRHRR